MLRQAGRFPHQHAVARGAHGVGKFSERSGYGRKAAAVDQRRQGRHGVEDVALGAQRIDRARPRDLRGPRRAPACAQEHHPAAGLAPRGRRAAAEELGMARPRIGADAHDQVGAVADLGQRGEHLPTVLQHAQRGHHGLAVGMVENGAAHVGQAI